MSILIHGLEMPMSCDICPMMVEADDYCVCYPNNKFIPWRWASESGVEQVHDKPDWCPIIHVPPHGRLIDADALMAEDRQIYRSDGAAIGRRRYIELYEIDDAPTIIPADPATGSKARWRR